LAGHAVNIVSKLVISKSWYSYLERSIDAKARNLG